MNNLRSIFSPSTTITIHFAHQTFTTTEIKYVAITPKRSDFKTQLKNFLTDSTQIIASARREMRERHSNLLR